MRPERRPERGWLLRLLCVAPFLLAACGGADRRHVATVFAASSLTEAFQELAAAFESEHPEIEIRLHFAGTPQLVLQLREGARADLFASADRHQMEEARRNDSVRGESVVFARNELVIVTESGNPHRVESLADLARSDLRVLLCGPSVPAGRYARELIDRAAVDVRPVSEEPNVKSVIQKIALGEADVGLVYRTDAAAAGDEVASVEIPVGQNVEATYPIASVGEGDADSAAGRFLAFALSDAGRSILGEHGFLAP